MTELADMYVVYHHHCQHVAGLSPNRRLAEAQIGMFTGAGRFGWRIRVGASESDVEMVVRGERCAHCTIDGQVTT